MTPEQRMRLLQEGARIGFDAAVRSMVYSDGTRPEFIEVINPYAGPFPKAVESTLNLADHGSEGVSEA